VGVRDHQTVNDKVLIRFLEQTKDGEYGEIKQSLLQSDYVRLPYQREVQFNEEYYFYSVR